MRTNKDKIILAIIPVIGAIIIASLPFLPLKCQKPVKDDSIKSLAVSLKPIAGKINHLCIYERYDDLLPYMTEMLKAHVPKELFMMQTDSLHNLLGDFIESVDTTYSTGNGLVYFTVKNQFKKGMLIHYEIFDGEGKMTNLFPQVILKK